MGCLSLSCLVLDLDDAVLLHDSGSLDIGELGVESLVLGELKVVLGEEALVTNKDGVILDLGEGLIFGKLGVLFGVH